MKRGETLINNKTEIVSLLLSMGNIAGFWKGAQDGKVTSTTLMGQNILDCPQVTSGGFLFVKAKYNYQLNSSHCLEKSSTVDLDQCHALSFFIFLLLNQASNVEINCYLNAIDEPQVNFCLV